MKLELESKWNPTHPSAEEESEESEEREGEKGRERERVREREREREEAMRLVCGWRGQPPAGTMIFGAHNAKRSRRVWCGVLL